MGGSRTNTEGSESSKATTAVSGELPVSDDATASTSPTWPPAPRHEPQVARAAEQPLEVRHADAARAVAARDLDVAVTGAEDVGHVGHGRHCDTPRHARDLPPAPVRAPAGRDRGDPRAPRRVGAGRAGRAVPAARRPRRPAARARGRGAGRARSPCGSRARPERDLRHPAAAHARDGRAARRRGPGCEPASCPTCVEVSLGEWEGGEFRIRMAEGDPIAIQAVAEERWEVIPGAETMEALAQRVRAGIKAVVARRGPRRARRGDRPRRRDRRDLPPGDRQPPVRVRARRQRLAHAA